MSSEDRVVTTSWLADAGSGPEGWAQLAPSILRRLDPLGLHVVVPAGHVHHDGEPLLFCRLQLHVLDDHEPLDVPLIMPIEWFDELPSAFAVLVTVTSLVAQVVDTVDADLAKMPLAGQPDGDNGR